MQSETMVQTIWWTLSNALLNGLGRISAYNADSFEYKEGYATISNKKLSILGGGAPHRVTKVAG